MSGALSLSPGIPSASLSLDFPSPIIPGLSDDVAMLCLARLPRTCLLSLRLVSKRWRSILEHPLLQDIRRVFGVTEEWLYVETWNPNSKRVSWYAFDSQEKKWRPLPPIPKRRGLSAEVFGRVSAVSKGNLYVVGGKAGISGPTLRNLYIYSPISNRWMKGRSMINTRHSPLISVLVGKLFVLGGFDCFNHPLHVSECYDFEKDEWTSVESQGHPKLPSPTWFDVGWQPDWLCITLANDRFYCSYREEDDARAFVKLYDPVTGQWQYKTSKMKALLRYGLSAVMGGKLHTIDWAAGRVRVADVSGVGWIYLRGLSLREFRWESILMANPRMAGVGSKLYVVRRGLEILVVELDGECQQGCLSYQDMQVGPYDNEEVVSCQVLAA
ncbi:hypothetical protein O6H91_01G163100 [Diphasiastrum complanatum]|uniref:Uncharacterized protein n=2 Tax=Diphasiastrum complanatum TaxID=34168 RepID=A0ACC2EYI3_DIPCM|nr:hypothetical protein O6H91_01G163100 [Diphasiastrum complanatum]KAJ7571436.1 hypothetical protein O6H91_01G163100 [Diphasiastrum complanatum]